MKAKNPMRLEISREEAVAMYEALAPFYAAGAVLDTANEPNGYAWVDLAGDEDELDLQSAPDSAEIISINGSWRKTPATYVGPTLTAGDFFRARDAFLAVVADDEARDHEKE